MSRTPFFFIFSQIFIYFNSNSKAEKYFEHSELSVLSVLDLARYSKQLSHCHSSAIILTKYNISMNQSFTVFVKDAIRSQIIQYYQLLII